MGNISKFPDPKGDIEKIYCETMDTRFPRVYRLQAGGPMRFALQRHYPDIGTPQSIDHVRSIRPDETCTVVVRWHPSFDAADAYLMTMRDTDINAIADTVCQTDQGFFTLIERATRSEWPFPMIFFIAEPSPMADGKRVGY